MGEIELRLLILGRPKRDQIQGGGLKTKPDHRAGENSGSEQSASFADNFGRNNKDRQYTA